MKGILSIVSCLLWAALGVAGAQAPAAARYLMVDGSRISYDECGTGPNVVLLHDGGSPATTWDAMWPLLCARFHVLRYDRRGVGRSDAPTKSFAQTDDLDALLGDRRISRATLVGSSSGGGIAIEYALVHPEKVDRLVLIGAVVPGMAMSDYFLEEKAASIAAHAQTRRYDRALERGMPIPAVTRLGEIRAPTLILVGDADNVDVHAHGGAIELGIWGARREIIRKAGHLIQIDQPALLHDRIVSFVDESPIVTVSAERLRALTGVYRSPFGEGAFELKNGRLALRIPGEHELPLFPSSDSTFYALIWGHYKVTFRRDSTGAMAADIVAGGRETTAVRTSTRIPPER